MLEALADRELPADIGRVCGFLIRDGYAQYMRHELGGNAIAIRITDAGLALIEEFVAADRARGDDPETDDADEFLSPPSGASLRA